MNISYILDKKWAIPAAVGVVSLGVGFGAGYFVGRRNSYVEYRYVIDKDDYEAKSKDPNQPSLFEPSDGEAVPSEPTVDEVVGYVQDAVGVETIVVNERNDPSKIVILGQDPEEELPLVTTNIFANPVPDWDYKTEQAKRSSEKPYVIHRDEFDSDDRGYRQETLTYYSGDDILTDPMDTPVYNFKQIIGEELLFGHGSGDPNVVYIRNEELEMEWEILNHSGRYEIEVLGLELQSEYENEDLKHGAHSKHRLEE